MASYLALLLLLLRFSGGAIAVSSSSYISRTTEQQVIATVAPPDADAGQSAGQPFLTSPSGSYAAYLRRGVDGSGSGSFGGPAGGGDVCYVEVVLQQGGSTVWESDCTPVGGADTCDLAFSPMGLELFAGGHSLWDTGVDAADPGMLSLDGTGDMIIVTKDGVTVWRASGDPWTGQRCSAASSSTDVLPPPSTTSAKLLTPPVSTFAGPWGTDFSFGDQPAPPLDTPADQFLPPPPADASTDSPYMPVPPPPADQSTDLPDLPLPPPPADMYPIPETPDQPLYSSPPPAPTAFVPQTPLMPPLDTPPLSPPTTGSGVTSPSTSSPSIGIATPPGSSSTDDTLLPPPPVGTPHPHHVPFGASPPVPSALAPMSGGAHGAGASLPFGQGNPQHGQGQGVFGQQQNQLLNGAGQPLENSSGGWSRSEHGRAGMVVVPALAGVVAALAFGFY